MLYRPSYAGTQMGVVADIVFEFYADGKGLIINDDTTDVTKERRRALLLYLDGPDVQDIFSTLLDTVEATDYTAAVRALNAYLVPRVNTVFGHQTFHKLCQKQGETVYITLCAQKITRGRAWINASPHAGTGLAV